MKNILLLFTIALLYQCSIAQSKKIEIIVDERVEVITTMQLLFGYPLVGKAEIKYKDEVNSFFAKHSEDSSVLYFLDIAQKYFSFGKPFNYAWHFTFPACVQIAPFSDYENTNYEFSKHNDSLLLFLDAMKTFYHESNFKLFYTEHQEFYNDFIAEVKKTIDTVPLVNILEKHYGIKQNKYILVLSPLSIEAGMSMWIETNEGNNLYSIIGPNIDSKVLPNFDVKYLMQYLVIHEFSHPFCNPIVDKYYTKLESDSCLYNIVEKVMKQQGCGDWNSALKELITRANEIILVEKIFGKDEANAVYDKYISQKWIYLKGLMPIIKKYDSNRNKYKTFEEITPEIVLYFDNEAKTCK